MTYISFYNLKKSEELSVYWSKKYTSEPKNLTPFPAQGRGLN
jgi:hypothetical protein